MDKQHLEEIINSYKWIKVKKYEEDVNLINEQPLEAYRLLEEHHRKETEFLINKCRDLAQELLDMIDDDNDDEVNEEFAEGWKKKFESKFHREGPTKSQTKIIKDTIPPPPPPPMCREIKEGDILFKRKNHGK